jgi:NAD-dependent deacetylase
VLEVHCRVGSGLPGGEPNAAHFAIAELQRKKPECWVLTQNVDGFHRAAGSPVDRLIEIHGQMTPLYCQACAAVDEALDERLQQPLPPLCKKCGGVMRPPVVLFDEMLPGPALEKLNQQMAQGFDAVLSIGTTASFAYIHEPLVIARVCGSFTAQINLTRTGSSDQVDAFFPCRAVHVMPDLVSHI